MFFIIALLGLFIAGVGLWGFIFPASFIAFVERFLQTPIGVYCLVGLRLLLGCLLIFSASDSRFPTLFYVIGVLSLFGAFITALLGEKNVEKYIQWWVNRPAIYLRLPMLLAWVLGVFLIYATL